MIRYFVNSADGRGIIESQEASKDCWIYMEAPNASEIEKISLVTGISASFLSSALDEEEAAHIDIEGDTRLAVIDIPKMSNRTDEAPIYTVPLSLIQNDSYIVSVCLKSTTVLEDFISGKAKNVDVSKRNRFIYQIMYNNFTRFLFYLKRIDRTSDEIQKTLSKSMQNKELLQLFGLQKSLVFFSASLSANNAVVHKLMNLNMSKSNIEEREILDDVLIESRQAMEMCSVYREIIKSSMDAFASVVNNNQNIVMKFLTAITIILSIPMLIASFWGMNTGVPFETKLWGFWAVVGISIVISIAALLLMNRRKML